jgi:murein DD-endopeptidase MepM/ murein hydrolase activator NlpD
MNRLLDNLSDNIQGIEGRRQNLETLVGRKETKSFFFRPKQKQPSLDLKIFYKKALEQESFFVKFSTFVSQNPTYLDSIPLIKPLQGSCYESAVFDNEKDPFTQTIKKHLGIDYIAEKGTPVIATASGWVDKIEDSKIWGKRIIIQHAHGFSTVYAHLGSISIPNGRRITKGDCIGTIGISGVTSGPHLHYEVLYQNIPVDPQPIFFPKKDSLFNLASR